MLTFLSFPLVAQAHRKKALPELPVDAGLLPARRPPYQCPNGPRTNSNAPTSVAIRPWAVPAGASW